MHRNSPLSLYARIARFGNMFQSHIGHIGPLQPSPPCGSSREPLSLSSPGHLQPSCPRGHLPQPTLREWKIRPPSPSYRPLSSVCHRHRLPPPSSLVPGHRVEQGPGSAASLSQFHSGGDPGLLVGYGHGLSGPSFLLNSFSIFFKSLQSFQTSVRFLMMRNPARI